MRLTVVALLILLAAFGAAAQAQQRADVYVFWAIGCPHCEREIDFLKRLEAEEARLRVHYLEVSRDARNRAAFAEIARWLAIEDPGCRSRWWRCASGRLRERRDERRRAQAHGRLLPGEPLSRHRGAARRRFRQ